MLRVDQILEMPAKQRDLHLAFSFRHQPKRVILRKNSANSTLALDREIHIFFDSYIIVDKLN
jgi:hypothetical protein